VARDDCVIGRPLTGRARRLDGAGKTSPMSGSARDAPLGARLSARVLAEGAGGETDGRANAAVTKSKDTSTAI